VGSECERQRKRAIKRGYRRRIVRKVRDPIVRAFWTDEYEQYNPRFQREAIAPIQNKLGQFLQNPVIRNILGQVGTNVRLPSMMDIRPGRWGVRRSDLRVFSPDGRGFQGDAVL
jgi:hypothetical protein